MAQEYKQKHQTELNTRRMYRNVLKGMIEEPDKLIKPKAWQKERDTLAEKLSRIRKSISTATVDLAKMEVLDYNRRELERMLENESYERSHQRARDRNPREMRLTRTLKRLKASILRLQRIRKIHP